MICHTEIYPCFTRFVRISCRREECIITNIGNGKWVCVSTGILACLASTNRNEMFRKITEQENISKKETNEFLDILVEHGFLDFNHHSDNLTELIFFPHTAYFNVTEYCNLECTHCYFGSHPGLGHGLSNDLLSLIVDNLRSGGINSLVVAGGEPLTRPNIGEMLAHIKTKHFQEVTLLTNCTVVTNEIAKSIANCVDNVNVSIDGPCEEINSILRGSGNFGKAIEGIRILKSAGVSKIRIIISLTSRNISLMSEMKKLCTDLDVELGTTIFTEVGRGSFCPDMSPKQKDLIDYFLGETQLVGCNSSHVDGTALDINAGVTCGSGTTMISVDCYGNVFPCHLFHQSEFKIGNILEEMDLIKLLKYSPIANQFRKRTVENRKCHGCDVEYFCKGGCLAHTVAVHKQSNNPWLEKDPYCKVHKTIFREQLWD